MVRSDLIGGIKVSLSSGQKLKDVMQSFFNAGYKKEDVEEAARILRNQTVQQSLSQQSIKSQIPQMQKPNVIQSLSQIPLQKITTSQPMPQQKSVFQPVGQKQLPMIPQAPRQVISSYPTQEKKSIDMVTVLLIVLLALLLGVLASVFLFKTQLLEFINQFLG